MSLYFKSTLLHLRIARSASLSLSSFVRSLLFPFAAKSLGSLSRLYHPFTPYLCRIVSPVFYRSVSSYENLSSPLILSFPWVKGESNIGCLESISFLSTSRTVRKTAYKENPLVKMVGRTDESRRSPEQSDASLVVRPHVPPVHSFGWPPTSRQSSQ